MSTAEAPNPYARGLFVKIEGAEVEKTSPGTPVLRLGNAYYDVSPYLGMIEEIGAEVSRFSRNPYDPRPLVRMQQMGRRALPHLQQMSHTSPGIRQAVQPMVRGLTSYLKNSQKLASQRLKTSFSIAKAPKILIPISLSIAAAGTTTAIQVRNPYLGATGGNMGPYLYPWTITSFRTSNGESGALLPIRLTQFLVGGHDFVAAALSGLTYSAGGAPATQGWPAAAFAETKRGNWKTEVQPWNVIAQNANDAGFGSVMTETGFLQIGVFNGGSGTYVDTYSVYANATLCGSPFGNAATTQIDQFRASFAPLALQAPLVLKIAGDTAGWLKNYVGADDEGYGNDNPYKWVNSVAGAFQELDRFLDSPPNGLAMGDVIEDHGMGLQGDARYDFGA